MANNIPFQAMGKTSKASANTSSQTITITPDGVCNQVCVANHQSSQGGHPVYFNVSTLSNVTVTAPTGGGSNATYCLLSVPGTIKSYTVPFQFSPSNPLYIAYITETSTSECYFTPGEGF